eukprot:3938292-Rhodomonas_salina.7
MAFFEKITQGGGSELEMLDEADRGVAGALVPGHIAAGSGRHRNRVPRSFGGGWLRDDEVKRQHPVSTRDRDSLEKAQSLSQNRTHEVNKAGYRVGGPGARAQLG